MTTRSVSATADSPEAVVETSGALSRVQPCRESGHSGVVLLHNVSWEAYEKLDLLLEGTGARLKFLDNVLEIMAPHSIRHEFRKGVIGGLVETYCRVKGIRYSTHGNATLKAAAKDAGGEPDECYCFHENKEIPDLVIEIALTSGGLDKLAFYERFEVPEVWIWRNEQLHVHCFNRRKGAYERRDRSDVLKGIDLDALVECAQLEYTSDAVDRFEGILRQTE